MQHLGKLLEMNQQKICSGAQMTTKTHSTPTSSHSNDVNKDGKRIDILFSRFAAFYGHVWRSQFKDEGFLGFAKKEWAVALGEFTDATLIKTILYCREAYEMPPTLPQVIHCARQLRKKNTFYVVNKDHVPVAPDVVISNLKQCKELLTKR